jgi:hypothetical protein
MSKSYLEGSFVSKPPSPLAPLSRTCTATTDGKKNRGVKCNSVRDFDP